MIIILFDGVETSNECPTACSDRGFQDCSVTLIPAPKTKNARKSASAPYVTEINQKALEIIGSEAKKMGTLAVPIVLQK